MDQNKITKLVLPTVYGPEALEPMRRASRLAAECLRRVGAMVAPGVTTKALDDAVARFCWEHEVQSACLGYDGFPAHCCTSVNHVVAHGIPNNRPLQSGDIVKVDVVLECDGWHGDTCATFAVGFPSVRRRMLIDVTKEALAVGIKAARPYGSVGDIGNAIQEYVKTTGFTVVEGLFGHGIGRVMHDVPNVPHVGKRGHGPVLFPGMFITIEPMINSGARYVKELRDGSIVTRDRSDSAQFEHTLAIKEDGVEILTV